MVRRLVRRQISNSGPARTSTPPSPSTPPSTPSTSTTSNAPLPTGIGNGVSSLLNSIPPTTSSVSQSTPPPSTPSSPTASSLSVPSVSTAVLPPSATGSGGLVTVTQTESSSAPPPSATLESKGKSFLENKPLSGFVFGLAGLAFVVIVLLAVTSFVRRRNRKRLLADASNYTFDPREVEDGTSDEKHSHAGLIGQHASVHAHSDYPPDGRVAIGFAGLSTGGVPRPGPVRSSPMPTYVPQDYVGHDGGYLSQYHNQSNVPVGYNPTPNPYDMYDPRNDRGYPNNQGQHDPYNFPGANGDVSPTTDPTLPRQLQPGFRPAQGPAFPPNQYNTSSPPMNYSLQIPSQTSSPSHYVITSASDQKDFPRLPTPGALPDTFGRPEGGDDVEDDAYGGASLGPESPLGQRTLQVANM